MCATLAVRLRSRPFNARPAIRWQDLHRTMTKLLYNILLLLGLPWVWARLFWKSRLDPAYRERIAERFGAAEHGAVADLPAGAIWFHTVSAGETNAAAPFIRAVRERMPNTPLLVTTMTPAGSARVRTLLGDIPHCYAPYDYPWAVARFLRRVRPKALVLMETELWPNLIARTAASGAPVYLVNARLSDRSFRRYRRVPSLIGPMLRSLEQVVCQYEDTAKRFRALGATAVQTIGSVKFDAVPPPDSFGVYEPGFGASPTWIAGSTHAGEEAIVLAAHRGLAERFTNMRLILVPRHPERAPAVARLAEEQGLSVGLLSQRATGVQVLLGDVMGTLAHLYRYADIAYIGGSLNRTGGHNPIEAAVCGLPMLMGPARFNVEEICARFVAAGCLHAVASASDIVGIVAALIADPQRRQAEGSRAKAVVRKNRGAQQRLTNQLCEWLGDG